MSIERIATEQVDEKVQQADRPVALDLWMDNCPPCDALAPKLKTVADAFEGRVEVLQVKVDEEAPILEQYAVKGMPTVLLFEDGNMVDRLSGLIRKKDLEKAFEKVAKT